MAHKICEHGELLKLDGGGYYFLCRFDGWEKSEEWRMGSQCRYARWCQEDRKYFASTDESGNMCPHFSLLRPKVSEPVKSIIETTKMVEAQIENEEDGLGVEEENMVDIFKSIFSDSDIEEKGEEEKEERKEKKSSRRKSE